jgi:hypothetical protein
MPLLTGLAISIGLLGGLATWLFVGHGQGLQIWAAFIAWASFYHCGGQIAGMKNTIICNLLGVVVGWICLYLITATELGAALGLPVWAGIVVAIGAGAMVLLANIPAFATIPASVYGFAAIAGFALVSGNVGAEKLMSMTLGESPALTVALSMIIGTVFAFASEKIGVAISASPASDDA